VGKSFEDLEVWKLARKLRVDIYDITESFPSREKYSLVSQMRRAVLSVPGNIAEGYGRYHYKENIQMCRIARGSLNELIDYLFASVDTKYITQAVFETLYAQAREVEKVLNGYIKYLQKQAGKEKEKE